MEREIFAKKHQKICTKNKKTGKGSSPACALHCGRQLYDYLTENKITLDIYYNQKKFNLTA